MSGADGSLDALALRAARLWGEPLLPPRPVSQRENAVYELRLRDGRHGALRLHRPGYQGEAAIRSELTLCAHLAEAGFPTPAPLPARSGALVEAVGEAAREVADGLPFREAGGEAVGKAAGEGPARGRTVGGTAANRAASEVRQPVPDGAPGRRSVAAPAGASSALQPGARDHGPAHSGVRLASVVSWLDGTPFGAGAVPLADAPAQMARLGRLLAQLHATLDRLALPPGFARPVRDAEGLLGARPLWGRFWESPALRPDEAARLRRFRAEARAALGEAEDFGPIHADPLRENLLWQGGRLWLIDFDDCCTGWRLYDLATALFQSIDDADFPAQRAALLAAYGSRRAIAADPRMLALFLALRGCASCGWFAGRFPPDHPGQRQRAARALRLVEVWERTP